jgi:hypothetical protein
VAEDDGGSEGDAAGSSGNAEEEEEVEAGAGGCPSSCDLMGCLGKKLNTVTLEV